MKLGQPDTTARRIGPLRAFLSGSAVTGEDFSGAGELEISINDGDWAAADGTVAEIGDGYYYYAPTVDEVSTEGFVSIKISGGCDEFTLREELERAPQGIPAGTVDANWLHAGPLYAALSGVAVTGENFNGAGEIEVSINGAAWQAAGGTVDEMSDGYYDYVPAASEVAAAGWLAVKINTVCDEYVIRVDITDTFVPSASLQFSGRVEAQMAVPTGGAAVSATNSGGGPTTCTVAAGNYYLTAAGGIDGLCDALEDALNTSRTPSVGAWSVTLSLTTGLVTINCTGTWSLSWTNTTLRDVLGFTANITSATTAQVGTKQAQGLWLPNTPLNIDDEPRTAPMLSDLRTTQSPTGAVIGLVGNTFYKHTNVRWERSPLERYRESSAIYANSSLEFFWKTTQLRQGVSWFAPNAAIQIYYDHAGTPTRIGEDEDISGWKVVGVSSLKEIAKKADAAWVGQWNVTLPAIVSEG